jgi:apolipoprotein N-acyltransferase
MPLPALRAFPLAFVLGALAACGFAPLHLWPLTFLCLAGLILLVRDAPTLRRAAAIGWWFGFGNFCIGLNWIATAFTFQAAMPAWLGGVAVVLASLYLAVFPALAAAGGWWIAGGHEGRRNWPLITGLAGAWIASEWLRATLFTGFAWNPIGVVWIDLGPLAGAARVIGTYGLSGLTILVSGMLLLALLATRRTFRSEASGRRNGRLAVLILVPTALAIALTPLVLFDRFILPPDTPSTPLIRVVQPNIGQDVKWDPAMALAHFRTLASLSGKPGARPRLIVWPEAAVPFLLEEDEAARAAIARLMGPRDLLLTGADAFQYGRDGSLVSATNSVFAMDARGRLLGRYDKAHLVPFGEYLPMRAILSRIGLSRLAPGDMDFLSGPAARNLVLPGVGPVGMQICYEIVFSGHVVDRAHRPILLVNPSNDAWFGRWGPPQHLAQTRLRAIEEALPIVRSTPTGISAVIDRDGRLLGSLPWRVPGAIDVPLPPVGAPTLFSRFGNVLPLAFALLLLGAGYVGRRISRIGFGASRD